jgi:hypothetical protein
MNEIHKGATLSVPEHFFEDGVTERFKVISGTVTVRIERGDNLTLEKLKTEISYSTHGLSELAKEWPEIIKIAEKLSSGRKFTEKDELWINELVEATGWDRNAIINELMNIAADPSERVERYKELYEEYFKNAKELKEKGDTKQAGEKLWGAVTALIKLYAAIKGIPILHWSIGKLEKFITNNVEEKYKALFRDLLDKTHALHEHFYEAHLDNKTFEERWKEAVKILEKAREVTIKLR